MAHEPRYVRFLLGIGVRRFSLAARYLPRIQEFVAGVDLAEAREFAARLLREGSVSATTRIVEATSGA